MDLKWASGGPVRAKSLLHRDAGRSGFGAALLCAPRDHAGRTRGADPAAPGEAGFSAQQPAAGRLSQPPPAAAPPRAGLR